MKHTPNFSSWRVTVLHRADSNTERLARQLRLLGLRVETMWEPLSMAAVPELLIVDADQGYDGLLPWQGSEEPPCPLIALLGSEAPSRIAWALDHGAGAILSKPLNPSAVYPALVMALSKHEECAAIRAQLSHLEERLKLRPLVHSAIRQIAETQRLSDDEAYVLLRDRAMQQRQPIEAVAAHVLATKHNVRGSN